MLLLLHTLRVLRLLWLLQSLLLRRLVRSWPYIYTVAHFRHDSGKILLPKLRAPRGAKHGGMQARPT